MVDVVLICDSLALDDAPHCSARRELFDFAEESLDLIFECIVELVAPAAEELDAVVLERIVGCGDDDAEVNVLSGGEMRNRGGREDTDASDIDARGREARTDRVVEEFARGAGVASDNGTRTTCA